MTPRFYICIALGIVIFLAGCLGGGRTKTEVVSKDMLKIKSIDIFPSKEVQPKDTIVIRMEAENMGQEDSYLLVDKDAKDSKDENWNGDYLLIDHCSTLYSQDKKDSEFQILSGGRCITLDDNVPMVKDSGGSKIKGDACYLKISPQQSQTFQWTMKAPTDDEIAKMTQKCMFKFQTAYAAKAVTNTYVYFADPLEVAQRLYTKKEMSLAGDNIASYGPVAVNFVPAEPQPVPAKRGGTWTVFLNMMNVGEGIADVNDLKMSLGSITKANVGLMASGCRMIRDIEKDIELVNGLDKITLVSPNPESLDKLPENRRLGCALLNYEKNCGGNKKEKICVDDEYTSLAKAYQQYCPRQKDAKESDYCPMSESNGDALCFSTLIDVKKSLDDELNDEKSPLQIYAGKSSRIPCELTVPSEITILTPFRFTTTADYTYKIREDIEITTKPIKERT